LVPRHVWVVSVNDVVTVMEKPVPLQCLRTLMERMRVLSSELNDDYEELILRKQQELTPQFVLWFEH